MNWPPTPRVERQILPRYRLAAAGADLSLLIEIGAIGGILFPSTKQLIQKSHHILGWVGARRCKILGPRISRNKARDRQVPLGVGYPPSTPPPYRP